MSENLKEFLAARNKALETLDITWARGQIGGGTDEVLLIALHKGRYECKQIAPELRRVSREWLEERKMGRLGGFPWPSDNELPE